MSSLHDVSRNALQSTAGAVPAACCHTIWYSLSCTVLGLRFATRLSLCQVRMCRCWPETRPPAQPVPSTGDPDPQTCALALGRAQSDEKSSHDGPTQAPTCPRGGLSGFGPNAGGNPPSSQLEPKKDSTKSCVCLQHMPAHCPALDSICCAARSNRSSRAVRDLDGCGRSQWSQWFQWFHVDRRLEDS